jgi:hypothetical protein
VIKPRFGAFLASTVLFVFTSFLIRTLRAHRGAPAPVRCHCFGGSDEISYAYVLRNVALIALALVTTRTPSLRLSLPATLTGGVILCSILVLHHLNRAIRENGLRTGFR